MNKTLKSLSSLAAAALVALTFTACDDFGDMNVSPTSATEMHAQFLLPTIAKNATSFGYEHWRTNFLTSATFVQQLMNGGGYDNYTQPSDDHGSAWWRVAYNGDGDSRHAGIKNANHLIAANKDNPAMVNYVSAARVLRAFMFMKVTDMYGDAPYFEGGRGALDDNVAPKYDPQQVIYDELFKEFTEAAASFEAGKELRGDVLFGGDVTKWKRFANSLKLRAALRLVKVDPSKAQSMAQAAIAGGVMQSEADMAVFKHDPLSTGPNGFTANGLTGYVFSQASPMLSEFMVNWLKSNNDPRLRIVAALYSGEAHRGAAVRSRNPDDQVGFPPGNDSQTIQSHPAYNSTFGFRGSFSQVGPLLRQENDPTFLQSYAEVEFMLAEAAVRGWHSGNAAQHYAKGVRAAMKQMALYDAGGGADITDAEIDAYLAANPYDASRALEQINTQYWMAVFLNGHEAWANYRRTGFPALVQVNFPGNVTGGKIPRRNRYPEIEPVLNKANYDAAVARQGADDITTRVWWDK